MKISQLLDSTPRWQHSDADVRRQAVQGNELEENTLIQLAQEDPDTNVRIEAIQRVHDEAALRSLLTPPDHGTLDESITAAVINRLAFLITSSDNAADRIAATDEPGVLIKIATDASDIDLRLESVKNLKNEESLERILNAPNTARVHQMCAELIEDPARLERIHKLFQDKNKNVTRTTRSKLKQIKEREAANETLIAECESICEALEKLARDSRGNDFQRQLNYQLDRWNALPFDQSVGDDTRARLETLEQKFDKARAACREILHAIIEEQRNIERQANEVVQELELFVSTLKRQPEKLDEVDSFLTRLRERWPADFKDDQLTVIYRRQIAFLDEACRQYRHWQNIRGQLEQLVENDKTRSDELDRLIGRLNWPETIAEPALLTAARTKLSQLKQAREEDKAHRNAQIEKVENQLKQLDIEIQNGRIKFAKKLESSLLKAIEHVNVPKKQRERLAALSLQLRELKDWQGFATAEKRKELCAKMEGLKDDETIHPGEKAKAIKELQDQWKALGPSDTRENQRLWSRFKAAGDAAFEPCAKYFAEQNELRERNLRERERICESLELYFERNNWENPDWKGVARIIHEAKDEWRRFRDIPNTGRKKVQKRFSRIMEQLETRLEEEELKNEKSRQQLIQRVKQLLEDDLPVAKLVAETKKIQTEWKKVGITRRAADHKLWREFRAQCDLVFARRDQERSEKQQYANQQIEGAKAVIDELKSLLDRNERIDKGELNQLRNKFNGFKIEKEGAQLGKEFNKLVKDAETRIKQQANAGELAMLAELRRKADICSKLEAGDMTPEEAEAEWDGNIELDPEFAQALDERRRLALTSDFDSETLAKNQETAELICVRMEILADLDSPPIANERRMQYQVERLNRGLSRGERETRSPKAQLRDLQKTWYCLGPIANNRSRLQQRFHAAEAVLEGARPN